MRHLRKLLQPCFLLTLALAWPALASAQRFEITPYIGFKSTGAAAVRDTNPLGVNRLEFGKDISFGTGFLFNVHNLVGLEFMWNQQPTEVKGFLPDGTQVPETADATLNQFHGLALIHTAGREVATRPYFLAGVGATRIGAGDSSKTFLSYSLGMGLKQSISDRLAVRVQGRWTPTYVGNTPEGLFCDAIIDVCWAVTETQVMSQGDFTAGISYEF